jgi:hypothetical protein
MIRSKRYKTKETKIILETNSMKDSSLLTKSNEASTNKSSYLVKLKKSQSQRHKQASTVIEQKQSKKELKRSFKMLTRNENDENIANYYVTHVNTDNTMQKL